MTWFTAILLQTTSPRAVEATGSGLSLQRRSPRDPTESMTTFQEIQAAWRFDGSALIETGTVLAVVGLLIALALSLWLWQRVRVRSVRDAPNLLFRRAAGEIGLSAVDQRLLERIARHQGLSSPLTLLMSPNTLDHHASHYVRTLPMGEARAVQQGVARVREVVFELSPTGATAAS